MRTVYDWFVHRLRILTVCSPAMVYCLAHSNCMRMFTVQFLELDHITVYKPMLNGIIMLLPDTKMSHTFTT